MDKETCNLLINLSFSYYDVILRNALLYFFKLIAPDSITNMEKTKSSTAVFFTPRKTLKSFFVIL